MAREVWAALGDVDNYIEPFAGSLAVLLERPTWHDAKCETVNDADRYLANFWRALSADPEAVAEHCDWPVNECCPAGTLIATPTGARPIELIKAGDTVWGSDGGNIVPTMVLGVKQSAWAGEVVEVGPLRVTPDHPVYTTRGYVEASELKPGMTIVRLAGEHDSPRLDYLRTVLSDDQRRAVCREDVPQSQTTDRTSIEITHEENASRLLDIRPAAQGARAGHADFRTRARAGVASGRAPMDSGVPSLGAPYKSHRRRRGDARLSPAGASSEAVVAGQARQAIRAGTQATDAGQDPFRDDASQDFQGGQGATPKHVCEGGAVQGVEGPGHEPLCGGVSGGEKGQAAFVGAQDEDCRAHFKPQSSTMHRDGRSVPVDHGGCEGARCQRGLGLPSDAQRLSLQRQALSPGEAVAVYNFQTDTGNYFADGILVHNCDLEARHLWLVNTGRERIAAMFEDPDFYDAKVAGWWVWGVNQWIGSGWCSGVGPWTSSTAGRGVNRQLPHLGDAGQGVNRQLPHLGNAGRGVEEYFRQLAARLRKVRVCCGDWARVVTDGATSYGASVGVFLDPPYSGDVRTRDLYATEGHDVSAAVREWALSKGDDSRFRIVLAGYEGEHEMPGWRKFAWSSTGAYKGGNGNDQNTEGNRHKERLWFSPHCIDVSRGQKLLVEAP